MKSLVHSSQKYLTLLWKLFLHQYSTIAIVSFTAHPPKCLINSSVFRALLLVSAHTRLCDSCLIIHLLALGRTVDPVQAHSLHLLLLLQPSPRVRTLPEPALKYKYCLRTHLFRPSYIFSLKNLSSYVFRRLQLHYSLFNKLILLFILSTFTEMSLCNFFFSIFKVNPFTNNKAK